MLNCGHCGAQSHMTLFYAVCGYDKINIWVFWDVKQTVTQLRILFRRSCWWNSNDVRNISHSSMKLLGNCVDQIDMKVGACLIDA